MTSILSKRIHKILPQVITSVQSCAVSGANICSSACNLLSFMEDVRRTGKNAAILSLDMFKAYNRVNLSYLEKVMAAMNFHKTFISWIILLHKGAKTKLLLDFMMEAISVLFSVRQGDPLAMLLYIFYIEPLLLRIQKVTSGFPLESPLVGGPASVSFEATRELLEGFVDDVEVVIVSDSELLKVDSVGRDFERISGAIINRSKKSKIMGLGGWKGWESIG